MEKIRVTGLKRAALVALSIGMMACDGGGTPTPAGVAEAPVAAPRVYTSRGVVLEVAEDALTIHHEAIDDYAGPDGKVTGMDSMVMRFPLTPQSRGTAVGEGDKVMFRIEARTTEPRYRLTEVKELPAGTVLDFRAAQPPGRR